MPRSPEIDAQVEAWVIHVVGNGAPVLHLESGRIGKAEAFYLPGAYIGANGAPVDEYVLELATGDRFLLTNDGHARVDVFVVLSPVEVQFLDATAGELSKTITRAIGAALVTRDGPFPIAAESALRLIRIALQGQMRALSEAPAEGAEG